MILRHAIALTAVGWYLMMPLRNHPEAPIGYWSQIGSYDSAKECEADQERKYEQSAATDSKSHEFHDLYAEAQCITDNDPRLKQ